MSSREPLPPRFVTLDALRGLAAMAVVVFHLRGAIERSTPDWAPGWLDTLFAHGYLGVDVFFVISGFVIAHSVRGAEYTLGYLGRFALRRSFRLDPPYWCAIALEIGLIFIGLWLIPSLGTPVPSVPQVVAHLFYAQNLLGYGDVQEVFWTLCFEVQFYVAFVLMLVVWQQLRGRLSPRVAVGALALLFVLSLAVRFAPGFPELRGWALIRWYQFFLGALTYWTIRGRCSTGHLLLAWAVIALTAASPFATGLEFVAVAVSAGMLIVARRGQLGTLLGGPVLQYFGRQSYSLYLLHGPIGWRVVSLGQTLLGQQVTPAMAWALFALGLACSVAAADMLWRLVERPSIGWSKRVPVRRPAPAPIGTEVGVAVPG